MLILNKISPVIVLTYLLATGCNISVIVEDPASLIKFTQVTVKIRQFIIIVSDMFV